MSMCGWVDGWALNLERECSEEFPSFAPMVAFPSTNLWRLL